MPTTIHAIDPKKTAKGSRFGGEDRGGAFASCAPGVVCGPHTPKNTVQRRAIPTRTTPTHASDNRK